jgi:hypothetical protein
MGRVARVGSMLGRDAAVSSIGDGGDSPGCTPSSLASDFHGSFGVSVMIFSMLLDVFCTVWRDRGASSVQDLRRES